MKTAATICIGVLASVLVGCCATGPSNASGAKPTTAAAEWFIADSSRCGTQASHVVFLIDGSGSMLETIDRVRSEVEYVMAKLGPSQDFHIVVFADGTTSENPSKTLVPASEGNKKQAIEWMMTIAPKGQTDPLPGFKRAFEVLNKADPKSPGKAIYLFSDGVFPDNDAVFKLLKDLNSKREVKIRTTIYDDRSDDAINMLKHIARDSGGTFKLIMTF